MEAGESGYNYNPVASPDLYVHRALLSSVSYKSTCMSTKVIHHTDIEGNFLFHSSGRIAPHPGCSRVTFGERDETFANCLSCFCCCCSTQRAHTLMFLSTDFRRLAAMPIRLQAHDTILQASSMVLFRFIQQVSIQATKAPARRTKSVGSSQARCRRPRVQS